jgi:hypothetical protein
MSLTDAILVLAAATLGAAAIIATSLDSLRKDLVDSLRSILSELEWQQNGTGTKMRRRTEQAQREKLEQPASSASSSVPTTSIAGPSGFPSMARTLGWRLGRFFARPGRSDN